MKRRVKVHPVVIGARLDGFALWVCCDSGAVLIQITDAEFEKRQTQWEEGDREEAPKRWVKRTHPDKYWAARCNGLTCTHELIMDVKKKDALHLLIQTLDAMQKDTCELD